MSLPKGSQEIDSSACFATYYFPRGWYPSLHKEMVSGSAFAKLLVEQDGGKLRLLLHPLQKTVVIDSGAGGSAEARRTASRCKTLVESWLKRNRGKVGLDFQGAASELLEVDKLYRQDLPQSLVNIDISRESLAGKAKAVLKLLQQGGVPRGLVFSESELASVGFRHWVRRKQLGERKGIRVADVLHDLAKEALTFKHKREVVVDPFQKAQGVDRHLLFVPLAERIAERLRREGFEVELHAMHPDSIVPGIFELTPAQITASKVKQPLARLAWRFPESSFELRFKDLPSTAVKTVRIS